MPRIIAIKQVVIPKKIANIIQCGNIKVSLTLVVNVAVIFAILRP